MRSKHSSLALAFVLLAASACSRHAVETTDNAPSLQLNDSLRQIVTLDTVRIVPLDNELILNGRITFNPDRVAPVYPPFGGNVVSIHAEIGDYVGKGDVLAVIRSSEVADLEKEIREAGEQLAVATRNLSAVEDMYRSGLSSARDLLQAKQEAANAQAEKERLDRISAIHNLSGEATYALRSPMAGFVIDKQVNRGMHLRSDQPDALFTVSGLDDVWVMADVYEGDISKVSEGAPVRITTLAYGKETFAGRVDKVYNQLDEESKTMKISVILKNEQGKLKPGMFANVYVKTTGSTREMTALPAKALLFENGRHYVVRLTPEGAFERQPVEVYKQTDSYCYLLSGVAPGQQVVVQNALLVYNALK